MKDLAPDLFLETLVTTSRPPSKEQSDLLGQEGTTSSLKYDGVGALSTLYVNRRILDIF